MATTKLITNLEYIVGLIMLPLLLEKLNKDYKPINLDESKKAILFINSFSYMKLRQYSEEVKYIDEIYIDGKLLCILIKVLLGVQVERVSFDNTSIADSTFEFAQKNKLNVGIVGSDKESIFKFSEYLKNRYPNIKLSYVRDGYFLEEDKGVIFENIIKENVELLILGLGSPLQELISSQLKRLGTWQGTSFTCGGFIHQTAASGYNYYPLIMDRMNIRFLYRIFKEPYLIRRYTIDYLISTLLFVHDVYNYKKKRKIHEENI